MFHVNRFDPSQHKKKQEGTKKIIRRKNENDHSKFKNKRKRIELEPKVKTNKEVKSTHTTIQTNLWNETKSEDRKKECNKITKNEVEEDSDSVSISSESTDADDTNGSASSSSVPSSESSIENDVDQKLEKDKNEVMKPKIQVIAPEQKFISTRKILNLPDEALDDFDIPEEVVTEENDMDLGNNLVEQDEKGEDNRKHQNRNNRIIHQKQEIEIALHMSKLPIEEAAKRWNLAPFLVQNLIDDGYKHFFPIQSLVIPDVITTERTVASHIRARDVCVSAPTGSGKTLAFVLPVINALANRKIRRLRALIVLPTRDLALQVFSVFQRYVRGQNSSNGLEVGLAIGQTDFQTEQRNLILGSTPSEAAARSFRSLNALIAHKLNPMDVFATLAAHDYGHDHQSSSIPRSGISAIDILVATPGRLLKHLDETPGFTLQHLQFLIMDEADRLLNQSYNNWIQKIHMAIDSSNTLIRKQQSIYDNDYSNSKNVINEVDESFCIDPTTYRKNEFKTCAILQPVNRPIPLRKFLFSATLTKDPQKLSSLGLVYPKHYDAHHLKIHFYNDDNELSNDNTTDTNEENDDGKFKQHHKQQQQQQQYSLPDTLDEYTVQCTAQQKPLTLLALIRQELLSNPKPYTNNRNIKDDNHNDNKSGRGIIVVFTVSLDATHRLTRLLQLLWGSSNYGSTNAIAEFSSSLNHKQRSRLLKRCNNTVTATDFASEDKRISVVVCSDGMSRGLDIPTVNVVIHYDVPSYAKTYVHRCGRTARAGRYGKAICILKPGQVNQFETMRKMMDGISRVKRVGIRRDHLRDALSVYPECLRRLKQVLNAEKDNELDNIDPLSNEWLVMRSSNYNNEDNDNGESSSSVPSSDESSSSSSSLDDSVA